MLAAAIPSLETPGLPCSSLASYERAVHWPCVDAEQQKQLTHAETNRANKGLEFFVLFFQLFICQDFLVFVVRAESILVFNQILFAHASLPPLSLNVSIPS